MGEKVGGCSWNFCRRRVHLKNHTALRQCGWMLCSRSKLLFSLRLCVDLVWFAALGDCLVETVATSFPTPDPLGGTTGRDGVQRDGCL